MCLLRELSKVVRTRKRGDSHQNFPLFDLIQVVFMIFGFPIKFYPEMGNPPSRVDSGPILGCAYEFGNLGLEKNEETAFQY